MTHESQRQKSAVVKMKNALEERCYSFSYPIYQLDGTLQIFCSVQAAPPPVVVVRSVALPQCGAREKQEKASGNFFLLFFGAFSWLLRRERITHTHIFTLKLFFFTGHRSAGSQTFTHYYYHILKNPSDSVHRWRPTLTSSGREEKLFLSASRVQLAFLVTTFVAVSG